MSTAQAPNATAQTGTWYAPCDAPKLNGPMTLIIALQTEHQIVLAADSLSYTTDQGTSDNIPSAVNKLHKIVGTDWVMACVGNSIFDVLMQELQAEIELNRRAAFDPLLEIGGPMLLRALAQKAREASPVTVDECWITIAGFDRHKKPLVLTAHPPQYGYRIAETPTILGAQCSTATWIVRLLAPSCTTIDAVKKLACFTIWQISKQELKVGNVSAGYPIHSCILEVGEPLCFEELNRSALDEWMTNWQEALQACFMRAVLSTPTHDR